MGITMVGDGYTQILHCEFVTIDLSSVEPDYGPIYCNCEEVKEIIMCKQDCKNCQLTTVAGGYLKDGELCEKCKDKKIPKGVSRSKEK